MSEAAGEIQAVYIYLDNGKIFTIKGGPEMYNQLFTRRLAEPLRLIIDSPMNLKE